MASYVKYEAFIENLCNKLIDIFGTMDTLKVALGSNAPNVATHSVLTDVTQLTGTGYTAGGGNSQTTSTRTGGTVTLVSVDFVWTATAGDWTAGRYVVYYDDTSTSKNLISYWDYGANFTLLNGETFTVDFGASTATLA